jgi:phosphoribosylformylglycinamidine synthase
MTAVTIDEAVRKVLAVGGDPDHIGGVDNFCWPTIQYHPSQNPDGKYKAAQLVRSNWALRDYCLAFGIPLLSGKDSMYIDGNLMGPYGEKRKVSGMPTLLFTVSSVIQDIEKCVTMDTKFPRDLIYILGVTKDELGGGEYYQMLDELGLHVPSVTVQDVLPLYHALYTAIQQELIVSAHAVARGGLAVHLALMAMGGELGMDIHLKDIPNPDFLPDTHILYSESAGRFIVTIDPAQKQAFEDTFVGMPLGCIGAVTDSTHFRVQGGKGSWIIEEDISKLKESWKRPFGGII